MGCGLQMMGGVDQGCGVGLWDFLRLKIVMA